MVVGTLWIAQVVAFAAGRFGPWRDAPQRHTNGRVAWPIRMGLSASLVLAAFLISQRSTLQTAAYARWIWFGMTASFIGDLIMARLIPVPNRLIGGMTAFGVAHGLYIAGYRAAIHINGGGLPNAGLWLGLVAYGSATVAGWWFRIRNPQKPAALNIGALLYGAWIGVMASCALALATALGGAWWLAALGGLSFVISDFLIGVTDIGGARLGDANDWIWLTYVAGQMGIIYAAWVASLSPGFGG